MSETARGAQKANQNAPEAAGGAPWNNMAKGRLRTLTSPGRVTELPPGLWLVAKSVFPFCDTIEALKTQLQSEPWEPVAFSNNNGAKAEEILGWLGPIGAARMARILTPA